MYFHMFLVIIMFYALGQASLEELTFFLQSIFMHQKIENTS